MDPNYYGTQEYDYLPFEQGKLMIKPSSNMPKMPYNNAIYNPNVVSQKQYYNQPYPVQDSHHQQ